MCECTVGSSGTAALLTKVPAHAGLILAVGLRLKDTQILCASGVKIKQTNHLFSKAHKHFIDFSSTTESSDFCLQYMVNTVC